MSAAAPLTRSATTPLRPSGGEASGDGPNALDNAIQVRISGSLSVGCTLTAKCKMPKGARRYPCPICAPLARPVQRLTLHGSAQAHERPASSGSDWAGLALEAKKIYRCECQLRFLCNAPPCVDSCSGVAVAQSTRAAQDGKKATYVVKPEDAGCWLRVACAPLLADGTLPPWFGFDSLALVSYDQNHA